MFHVADIRMEPKERALVRNDFQVRFQGNYFRPCVGLVFWIRWGRYIFDIRPLRKYFGLPELSIEDMSIHKFKIRMKEIIKEVGDLKFITVNMSVNDDIKIDNELIIMANHMNGIDDDLPF